MKTMEAFAAAAAIAAAASGEPTTGDAGKLLLVRAKNSVHVEVR